MDLSRGVGGLSPVSPGSDPQALSTANDQQSQQQESPDAGNKTLLDKIVQTYTKDAANRTSRIMSVERSSKTIVGRSGAQSEHSRGAGWDLRGTKSLSTTSTDSNQAFSIVLRSRSSV